MNVVANMLSKGGIDARRATYDGAGILLFWVPCAPSSQRDGGRAHPWGWYVVFLVLYDQRANGIAPFSSLPRLAYEGLSYVGKEQTAVCEQ